LYSQHGQVEIASVRRADIFGDPMASPPPRRKQPEPLFPKLSGHDAALGAEWVARHQRGRLLGATVEAVARQGYEQVTVGEVVALAGVSKSVFYQNFAGKEECFFATFEEIVERGTRQIEAAYLSREGFSERLAAGTEAMVELLTEQNAAAHLVFVDSLSLGAAAVGHRERATARFESMLGQGFAQAPLPGEVAVVRLGAIVGGLREIIYRRLRDSEPERLRGEVPELVEWALGYRRAASTESESVGAKLVRAVGSGGAARQGAEQASRRQDDALSWEEPANSPRSRKALTQRERIMRAAAQVTAAKGYGALSVAAISAAAGTSNQTFYKNFASKQEAFLAAFDALALKAFELTAAAYGTPTGWLEAGAAGVVALLEHFAADPLHRQLVFFELAAAGPAAVDRAEAMLEAFIEFLQPDPLPAEAMVRPPRVAVEAVAGGIWAVVQHEVAAGRGESLPQLGPEILDFALVPFGFE
jgi:AcrR family transcriptional regulator